MDKRPVYTLDFSEIGMKDVPRVGGKNASLGEMFKALKPKGVGVIDGFATTAAAYWRQLSERGLREKLEAVFIHLDPENLAQLAECGLKARAASSKRQYRQS
jgi:pyruvate,water dikinase